MPRKFRKVNYYAIIGFLMPFMAGGFVALLIVVLKRDFSTFRFMGPYLTVVPGLLILGLICSIRSIPLIPERNDKDYAFSGLTLNIVFFIIYGISLVYFFWFMPA